MNTKKSEKPLEAKRKPLRYMQDLYDLAGSAAHLAVALGMQTSTAVELWKHRGIPQRHWDKLYELYGITPAECYSLSNACRKRARGE